MAFPQTSAPTETSIATPTTSLAVNMPATVEPGDLLRAVIGLNNSEAFTEDSGDWTKLWEFFAPSSPAWGGCFIRKVADQTEADALSGGTVSFTSDASTTLAAQVYRIPAASWFGDISTGVAAGTAFHDGSTDAPDPPSLTAPWSTEDSLWFADVAAVDDDVTADTAPAGYTGLVTTVSGAGLNAGCAVYTARRELAAATENPGAFGLQSVERCLINTVVVRPAAAAAGEIGLAQETDTAQPIGSAKSMAVGLASETDTAQPVSATTATLVGQAEETDIAFGITATLASEAADLWGQEDRVLCMVASPFDETLSTTHGGPLIPLGKKTPVEAINGWTATGGETQIYLSDIGYTSKPDDTPADQHFEPRLVSPFNYQVRVLQGDEAGGRARAGFGEITIANSDGGLDDKLDLGWDGRTIRYYEGRKGAEFSTFTLRAVLTTDGLTWDEGTINIRLRDQQGIFARTIEADFYSGDGGEDGDAGIAGIARPQAYGELFNVEPLLIDSANLIYQFHDRLAQSVVAVRDRGVDLDLDTAVGTNGDAADYTALAGASVTAGQYATALSQGLIRLGSAPDGRVTADVKGDALGSYVDTDGGIIRRIVTTRMGGDSLDDPGGLDTASFTQLDSDQASNIGYYVGTDRKMVDQILDEIMISVGGFWDMTLLGRLHVAILQSPTGAALDTLTKRDIAQKPKLQRTGIRPVRITRVGYKRMQTVQSADELASGVTAENRALYSREYRFALTSDQGVAAKHKLAREVEIPGLFADQADADTEAGRFQTLYGGDLSLYAVSVRRSEFARNMGDIVSVEELDRFGFSSIQKFRLVGKRADSSRGQTIWELLG